MKVAIIWLINNNGDVLLAQRSNNSRSDAGKWGPSVSGKIEPGETADKTVIREAFEELGIPSSELNPVYSHEDSYGGHYDGRKREFEFYHSKVKDNIDRTFRLEPREVQATKWISLDALGDLLSRHPNEIVISEAARLWENILVNLKRAII